MLERAKDKIKLDSNDLRIDDEKAVCQGGSIDYDSNPELHLKSQSRK
jgi:hypothetical protein